MSWVQQELQAWGTSGEDFRDQRVQGMSWTWPAPSCFLCCFPSFLVWAWFGFLAQGMVSTMLFLGREHTCHSHSSAVGLDLAVGGELLY